MAAELKVIEILESQTFVAYLSDTIISQIMGRDGKQLAKLRYNTNANIKISPRRDNGPRKVLVTGRRNQVLLAREKILDVIDKQTQLDLEKVNSGNCYENFDISEGSIQLIHYVKDQLPSNPSLFFIQFPAPLAPDVEYKPIVWRLFIQS